MTEIVQGCGFTYGLISNFTVPAQAEACGYKVYNDHFVI
jgi:hypothetical protein